ncbi:MAG: cytochrome c [Rhodobacteraceae bacterium]|nr:cytochrome c [Paracoccaceae bacterium]
MRRIATALGLVAALAAGILLGLDRPQPMDPERLGDLSGLTGDPARGERVFWASGCASCHAAQGAEDEARLILAGGRRFETDFGTFVAPNISPDATHGIGGWRLEDMARALWTGVSPGGEAYFPAFPYTAYVRMQAQDVADLWAFMETLPPAARRNEAHDLPLALRPRLGLGLWNRLHLRPDWAVTGPLSAEGERGRYLAEALAHCGECHTPRTALGGLDTARWMAGAANPSGTGRIPAITPDRLGWSVEQIAAYLDMGLTPDFDTAGGSMADVVKSLHRTTPDDRRAIALYLMRVPPSE